MIELTTTETEVELRCRGRHLENGYDVITLLLMVLFGRNSAGKWRMICMRRLLDMNIENAQTGLIHAPKQQY